MQCTPKVEEKAAGTGGPWATHFTHSREMAKLELERSAFFLLTWLPLPVFIINMVQATP